VKEISSVLFFVLRKVYIRKFYYYCMIMEIIVLVITIIVAIAAIIWALKSSEASTFFVRDDAPRVHGCSISR